MPMLSTTDLTSMSTLVQQLAMKDTCNVLRRSRTSDSQGGSSQGGWAVAGTYPCAIVEPTIMAQEPFKQSQLQSKTMKTALLPSGTDVRDSDRLQVGAVYYEIIAVAEPTTFEVVRRVYVQRQGQGAS